MTSSGRIFFSIVIVSLNGEKVLPVCLDAVFRTKWEDFEVILVDNGSTDNTAKIAQERYPLVKLIQAPRNLGFAGGNNLGIREARGEFVILLNDDTEVNPLWLEALSKFARKNTDAGILGCKLLYPDGKTIQHAGGWIEPNGLTHHKGYGEEDKGQFDKEEECEYVTGAAFAIKRQVIQKIGLLDSGYFPIYFEEIDYCVRAKKAGFNILYVPDAVVIHHESRTTDRYSPGFLFKYHKNRLRFLFRNKSLGELFKAAKHEVKWLIQNKPRDTYRPLFKAWLVVLPRAPVLLFRRIF
ncbi:glycosyltransferase family 2 protein [Candidatus Sumerlaeota bacterium]|nr:glycosyltransferase family 2 protein [Candidatus Sumerlaeota bacterium]